MATLTEIDKALRALERREFQRRLASFEEFEKDGKPYFRIARPIQYVESAKVAVAPKEACRG